MIRIGSLFAGIGGFERGIEAAIDGAETIWQVEQDSFCQKVLKKHWPNSKIYNDVRDITRDNVEPVDMLIGGFPCQDISLAGKGEGLDGKKSGLWWEMHRIISELRPRVVVMENVSAITIRGGLDVLGSLASIGYDAEWSIVSARSQGAPHRRDRWFCVAWPTDSHENGSKSKISVSVAKKEIRERSRIQINHNCNRRKDGASTDSESRSSSYRIRRSNPEEREETREEDLSTSGKCADESTDSERKHAQISTQRKHASKQELRSNGKKWNFWQEIEAPSPLCRVDDGIPDRIHRLKALGNAIVPQCSEYIGRLIVESGLLR
mgnify:CR=1 FL=1